MFRLMSSGMRGEVLFNFLLRLCGILHCSDNALLVSDRLNGTHFRRFPCGINA